jgi:hypothetical protein
MERGESILKFLYSAHGQIPLEQSRIWNFWLLLVVKPDSTFVPTFSFDVLLIDSKMTTSHGVSAPCGEFHHISMETTSNFISFFSSWMPLNLPWPIKRHTFVLFILDDPSMPNSTSVGSPLLIRGLEDFFTWQSPLQPYKASSWSSSSLQLMSCCGVGKPTAGLLLTG